MSKYVPYEQEERTEADWILLRKNSGSKYNAEALIKKRVFEIQEKERFQTTYDFLLEELDELIKEIESKNDSSMSTEEKDKLLIDALSALAGMWNQYCPPPRTHKFMGAGENAEDILTSVGLMRENQTAIDFEFEYQELPEKIKEIISSINQQ